ncbi:SAUR-like auxin-responsive family protein [Rhynchospora pubera]|uniref:SAUR-like auxin-responsive family protein n=1 Tax=Rhynchospora pubera TaxID=906938 RepID=A0AAV8CYE2_9POAL|nr:SAUR-like auxin-responsive family protein [Rhynchospora pubera]
MKRHRGFRLGRKLVTLFRRTFQFRRRKHYLCLNTPQRTSPPSVNKIALASKLFNWGKQLKQLIHSSKDESYTPLISCNSDNNHNKAPPKGHLAVYVAGDAKEGGSPRRFVVPVVYFNHPLFGELLKEAEEEFGYGHPGGITIPCPVSKFEKVQTRIASGADRICRRSKWGC